MEAPADVDELLARAKALGGRTVPEVAGALGVELPPDPKRAKGFMGQLVERALGACPRAGDGPDFPELGVELKTLPIAGGRVRESTFVCTAEVAEAATLSWERSRVRRKLRRVLFVAVERQRPWRYGAAWLWTPSPEEEAALRADWEELMGAIGAGEVEAIDASRGRWLQLRPKGATAACRVKAYDADGAPIWAPTKGFYLRASFTRGLLHAQRLR